MIVTGAIVNSDGMPDALQQPRIGFGAPVQYDAPVQYGTHVKNFGVGTHDGSLPHQRL